jgi:hypothetical protein
MQPLARLALTLALATGGLLPAATAGERLDVHLRWPHRAPTPARCGVREWVPGHYETILERHWRPGATRQEWLPARHEWRRDRCGRPVLVLVEPGRWITITEPGRFETRERREWIPGHWRER